MFSYAFIFITLTLMFLVLAAFWLKVPKASFPLIIIYTIFIFNNNGSENSNEQLSVKDSNIKEENINAVTTKESTSSFDGLASIEPKPITFDADKIQERKTQEQKKKSRSDKKIIDAPKVKEEVAAATLMVKDIKICKKIYKRTPVGSDIVFTNSVDSLYCYTRIQNTGSKKEVKHIWYFENQIMTQVRYNVKKSNIFRSWTKKTILPHQVGKWRVDVHDNHGTIIGSKEFQIKNISNYN